MIVVEGDFDPITETELHAVKQLHLNTREDVFLQVNEKKTVLDYELRLKLVKLACKPYRHLQLIVGYCGKIIDFSSYQEDEKEVRRGIFRNAAYGTRKYIFQNGLYFKETVEALCTPQRYEHSIRVAETARRIAIAQHVDAKLAYQAGLLHDITKAISKEDGAKIIKVYRPEWLNCSEKIWHSYTAVIWMKQNMGFYDETILHAIEHHTLGDGNGKLCRIIYIADKIEPGRGYDTFKHMQLACHDLRACSDLIHEESKEYRKNKESVHE